MGRKKLPPEKKVAKTSVAMPPLDIAFLKALAIEVFFKEAPTVESWMKAWGGKPSVSAAVRWLVSKERDGRARAQYRNRIPFRVGKQKGPPGVGSPIYAWFDLTTGELGEPEGWRPPPTPESMRKPKVGKSRTANPPVKMTDWHRVLSNAARQLKKNEKKPKPKQRRRSAPSGSRKKVGKGRR